jgi:hypothetical protein
MGLASPLFFLLGRNCLLTLALPRSLNGKPKATTDQHFPYAFGYALNEDRQ